MLRSLALALVALLACAATDAASIDVPVLLPSKVDLDIDASVKVYTSVVSHKGSYELSLSGAKSCQTGACFLALFEGHRREKLGHRTNVALASGLKGYYAAPKCGASCGPTTIAWVQKGVRYELQAKALGGRKAFVALANSAIRAGNRG
jgi:hypothetical protein